MQWQTNNAAQTSAPSVTAWWGGLPIGTRFVFGLNALVYLGGLCVPKDWAVSSNLAPQHFCMWPRVIWAKPSEWYRVFTSAFVHGGLMHIGFNMFNFVVSGPNLEYRIGTLCLLNLILALVAVLGALDMIIAYGGLFTNYPQFWNECSVGFSGVIFALITAESLTVPADTQYSIFGVPVPARWYPWAMLVFTQLIMPNVSLIGHLVGILGAYLWRLGVLNPLLLPSAFFIWVENTLPFKILRHPAWQRVTEEGRWRSGAGVVGNGIATGTSRAFAIGGLRMWGAAQYFCGALQTSVCKPCAGCAFWRRGNVPESEHAITFDSDTERGMQGRPQAPERAQGAQGRFFGSGTWGSARDTTCPQNATAPTTSSTTSRTTCSTISRDPPASRPPPPISVAARRSYTCLPTSDTHSDHTVASEGGGWVSRSGGGVEGAGVGGGAGGAGGGRRGGGGGGGGSSER